MVNRKIVENSALFQMFGDDSDQYAGFNNIVTRLIEDGECLTTIQAKGIDFGMASAFIKIEDTQLVIDGIKIVFLRKEAIKCQHFIDIIKSNRSHWKRQIDKLQTDIDYITEEVEFAEAILNDFNAK